MIPQTKLRLLPHPHLYLQRGIQVGYRLKPPKPVRLNLGQILATPQRSSLYRPYPPHLLSLAFTHSLSALRHESSTTLREIPVAVTQLDASVKMYKRQISPRCTPIAIYRELSVTLQSACVSIS
jgi:hypothetical protein